MLFVLPIGGADMPVVISLLNAFTGLAAAATGFELGSNVLIVSGALVGASGTLLTMMMGRAMNRSIGNVLFGAFGKVQAGAGAAAVEGTVRSATVEDVGDHARVRAARSWSCPGYGMAVAQAQHAVRELADVLEKKGIEVDYAIHPVAGRMPGHMNVLLAEANVPYTALKEMDEINPQFAQTDVVARDRRERRRQPGRAERAGQPDLRDADPERRPVEAGRRDEALDGDGLRRRSTTRSSSSRRRRCCSATRRSRC